MLTHNELTKKMLSNSEVKAEYDLLEDEFTLFEGELFAVLGKNGAGISTLFKSFTLTPQY